ncbi:polymeric immunoglobulin receptor isoform X1 [Labrus mixtus]|uniref:polymeric immunoglobulin receptor isoform X1 n=1 Tax=Labrus mixtus TaxID=508554 RepID=UPI0029C06931|nr:polymeric immunoglobulin receptor isoform X1 [Labrus mixtus]
MLKLYIRALSLVIWIPAILCGVTTEGQYSVLEGQTVVIPCHYEPQYEHYVKYWCRGATREFCTSLARTDYLLASNAAKDKTSISDDMDQLVFTVTMKNVNIGDTGWYICGVEIGSIWSADVVTFSNIRVIDGMSVVNTQVTGEEGGSVTVECLYSERYRESRKKWCRSGDWSSCLLTDSGASYEDASVAIIDDRTRTYSVTLKTLQLRDAGWYTCSAGKHKISVRVLVTPRPKDMLPVTSTPAPTKCNAYMPAKPMSKESTRSHHLESWLMCSAIVLLLGVAIFGRKLWKVHNPKYQFIEQGSAPTQNKDNKSKSNKYPQDVSDQQDTTVVFLNRDDKRDDAFLY